METGKQKTLTVTAWVWCDEAARLLGATLRGVPCYTVDDYRREVEGGADTRLLRVATAEGATVGFVVVRIERYAGGAEGVILAASGRLAGVALYEQILPVIEGMFYGVKSFRIDSCRPGANRKLIAAGYLPTHVVWRKPAPGRAPRTRDELLDELAAIDAPLGGGHLCAGPGARPHKGGSSNSTTAQTTQNLDSRMVVDGGSVGVNSDAATVTVNTLDGGAIWGAQQVANNALQSNYLQSRAALDAMRQANALIGEVNAQSGRTVADALQFGTDAFSGAADVVRMGTSDVLQLAGTVNADALDAVRMSAGDALYFARDAQGNAFDLVRMGASDALGFARDAQGNALDAVRMNTSDALYFAGDAQTRALDAVRMGTSDALQFADNAATRADDKTWRTFSDALAYSQNVFDTGVSMLDRAREGVSEQANIVAAAYDNARGEGTQKSYIAAAALAVVALGALSIMGKR